MALGRLLRGLKRTRDKLADGLGRLFGAGRRLDDDFLEELEELLYTADLGNTGSDVVEQIQAGYKRKEIKEVDEVREWLRQALLERIEGAAGELTRAPSGPTVILVAGVNGSGKTTSIAKLAHFLQSRGDSVLLCASDTFRAAAVEQLVLWSERIGCGIIQQGTGADPAAVAFDATEAAVARGVDWLVVDTAGRLHTQKNLMRELEKIVRVIQKRIHDAPHETLLVLDATTGQNAIRQASEFSKVAPVSGLILAKLDGTAKGGAVFGIREHIDVPVKFVGLGEQIEDLAAFDPVQFVDGVIGDGEK
ncbi:MAG: signal recognition particle-docking protein FtsY [Planctomycetes bacterium]|nr:signal recognition particle-docking protein FtsY [Planctomycetota bacterium]MDP6424758.1 signal recognition particle-docking protein FtsY [Planctomycetota bacterium]